ncbi:MAG TPA: rhomboid family intramembrane serine protease [Anaerolineales bacterium]|jgi:membrane associated rhomboid family serine protease|nr:rhomboid family intramembrane serine protease [Anaerolineales bacterium]
MIPIRDTIRSYNFPVINWLIIILNSLVFLYQLTLPPTALQSFIGTFGMVPSRINLAHPASLVTLFTNMFLHGGWFHIISNMWVLYIFGDNVEDRMGSGRYLVFYLLGGLAANLLQLFFAQGSSVPTIGASGAIAGVLGGYFLLFPRSRVITLILLFIFPWFVEIPAVIFLGFWFVSQLFSGLTSLGAVSGAQMGGIAWWAHVGGFVFGLLLVRVFSRRPRAYNRWYGDEYWPW